MSMKIVFFNSSMKTEVKSKKVNKKKLLWFQNLLEGYETKKGSECNIKIYIGRTLLQNKNLLDNEVSKLFDEWLEWKGAE